MCVRACVLGCVRACVRACTVLLIDVRRKFFSDKMMSKLLKQYQLCWVSHSLKSKHGHLCKTIRGNMLVQFLQP